MATREEIKNMLGEICPAADLESTSLVDDEIIDSFDIVAIVSELVSGYGVDIGVEDILPENFNSVDAIMKLIESKS